MKKQIIIVNILLVMAISAIIYVGYDYYEYSKFVAKVEAINSRIDYLHKVKGYSVLEAKHIADVEFGLSPSDAEYKALIKE